MFNLLHMQKNEVVIFTGPINTGKTTLLMEWCKRWKASGILTPRSSNGRLFYYIGTGESFPMEASGNEEVLEVGQFRFSKNAFDQAIDIIRKAWNEDQTDWLIIDEIGPMELRGEGFSQVLSEMLQSKKSKRIILVVREKLVKDVIDHFHLERIHVFKI